MSDLNDLIKQCDEDGRAWFPSTNDDLTFKTLAMMGEAGELANLVKKVARGTHCFADLRNHMAEEAVDVLIYLCEIFAILGVDPIEIYREKREKNVQRFSDFKHP